jgi:hypothetical protein
MRRGRKKGADREPEGGELEKKEKKEKKDSKGGADAKGRRGPASGGEAEEAAPPEVELDVSLDRAAEAADTVLRQAEDKGGYAGVRAGHVRAYVSRHELEKTLSAIVSKVLGEPQLRWPKTASAG